MGWWYGCEVTTVGPACENRVFIALKKDGKFEHWFEAATSERKEMLATALAALTSGFRVQANIEGPEEDGIPKEFNVIHNLYLGKYE